MVITKSYYNYMNKKTTPFSAALEYLIRTTPKVTQKKLAESVGINQSYISALKNGDRDGHEEVRRKIAKFFKKSYDNFLLLGEGIQQEYNPQIISHVVKGHQEFIKNFIDKETGIKANDILIRLEKLDTRKYYGVIGDLEGLVKELEKSQSLGSAEDSNKKTT